MLEKKFEEIREISNEVNAKYKNASTGLFVLIAYDNGKQGKRREVKVHTQTTGRVDEKALERMFQEMLTYQMCCNDPEKMSIIKKRLNERKKNKHKRTGDVLPKQNDKVLPRRGLFLRKIRKIAGILGWR